MNPKKRVIDENAIRNAASDNDIEDEDEEDQYDDRSDINSQYYNESVTQGDIPDDATVKSGGTMNRINFNASSTYGGTVGRQQTQEASISHLDITDQLETEANTLYKSKNTSSKKSLKSIGINDRKGSRKQLININ